MSEDIFTDLNPAQLEAVTHFTGPMLVVAGAGSGKTRALTHRIAHLIQEKGISPWNILAVTFTNKAAKEMQQRVIGLLGANQRDIPTIGTFHSVCVRILRKHIHLLDYENAFAIYDMTDQQVLMKRIMGELAIDPKKVNPKAVLSHISNAKNQLIGPQEYRSFSSDFFTEKVADLYPRYQAALQRAAALDFDDIIMKTVQLFQQHPDILDGYQEKFRFISVDEYQDTNRAQYCLIELLAQKYQNLCVIGDADQSIYSWRGATIQNIMDFEKDYPEARVVVLEQNYRSTQIILDGANLIISRNAGRKEKKLWTEQEGGEKIKHWLADNERHEAEMVAQEITGLQIGSEYPDFNSFVVLYRTNAQSRVLEEVFLRYGIPYRLVGGVRFYERKEIKDILAYLRVIQNPNDVVSLLRIINVPSRKIGAKTLETLQTFATQHQISLFNAMLLAKETGLPATKAEAIEEFVKLIKHFQDLNSKNVVSSMIKVVLEESGYKKMINNGSVEGEARLENIAELVSVAHKYDKLEPGVVLSVFLEEVSLISDVDSMDDSSNAVTFMTVHAAKGLEFPNVFITGLEEGIFPHNRALMDRQELEEERRLMYVAMTRAMERLYLLHARSRMLYGEGKTNPPSQFFEDIIGDLVESNFGGHGARQHIPVSTIGDVPVPVEIDDGFEVDFAVGDRVSHKHFGAGVVVDISGGVATVAFDRSGVGVKKLALSISPLVKC
jgi:DNA helicase II / ATP-dependent DNA helicase PcrA